MAKLTRKRRKQESYVRFEHNERLELQAGALGSKNGKSWESKIAKILSSMFPGAIWADWSTFDGTLEEYNGRMVIVEQPRLQSGCIPDFLIINSHNGRVLAVEVKFYGGNGGSLEGLVFKWLPKTRQMKLPSIMILAGSGWKEKNLEMLQQEIDGQKGKLGRSPEPFALGFYRYEEENQAEIKAFIKKQLRFK